MRILRLSFQNLNSLTGKWEIDFSHSSFTGDGIFAITGPTGAGKTTILDAICLALYGRTPRLDRVTKSGNEIMSRQQGECFAEVEFSTVNGRYLCHWYQRRSHRKPDGVLQSPTRELSMLNSGQGQILASGINKVVRKVEQVTGMDFDRFTRSMLLAQGGFAAFLQATQDERAPILEQITGSGIYTEISKRVHERCTGERIKLEKLQEQVALMQLLTPAEEEEFKQNQEHLRQEESDLGKEIEQKTAALTWLKTIAATKADLVLIKKEQTQLEIEQQNFVEDEKRLALAQQALILEGDYATLVLTRKQQQEESKAVAALRIKQPEQEAALTGAAKILIIGQTEFEENRQAQEQGAGRIREVRDIDLRIREKDATIKADTRETKKLRKKNSIDEGECKQFSLGISKAETKQIKIKDYLAVHAVDEQLVTDLTGIGMMLDRLGEDDSNHAAVILARDKAEKQDDITLQEWKDRVKSCSAAEKLLQTVQQQRQDVQNEVDVKLNGRRTDELHNELNQLNNQRNLLARLLEIVHQQETLARESKALVIRQKKAEASNNELIITITGLTQKKKKADREVELQQTHVALANRIRDLEEERNQLQDDTPCPLCGALDHPYARGNVPALDELKQELQKTVEAAQQTDKFLADARINAARFEQKGKDLQNQIRDKETAGQEAEQYRNSYLADLAPLAGDEPVNHTPSALTTLLADLEKRLTAQQQQLDLLYQLDRKLGKIIKSLEQQQTTAVRAAQEQERATHAKENAEQELKRLSRECVRLQVALQESRNKAKEKLAVYGITDLPVHGLKKLFTGLGKRRDQWQQHQKESGKTEQDIASLQTGIRELQAVIATRTTQVATVEQAIEKNTKQRQHLAAKRASLFGNKDTDAEERQLAFQVKDSDNRFQKAQKEHNHLLRERDLTAAAISSRDTSIGNREKQLKPLEAGFAQRLTENNFVDEIAYCAASLDEEKQAVLTRRANTLRTSRTQLDERLRGQQSRLEKEEKRQLTESEPEQLQKEQDELAAKRKQTTEKIGSINQRLSGNTKMRDQQQNLLQSVDGQKKEYARWKMLHDLIGSADGKKYRNFAQGLTFELMVSHANQQLAKMTDRYLLVRDTAQPLELNVIDSWQAGEIRSTKNLSGGESFVVSLALALGLSNMVGGNVRVDSLFLDEGFGALDEEALETALETLAGLRREGKLIGVISHVAALKERIATQVEVVPGSGGQSKIRGAGVKEIE